MEKEKLMGRLASGEGNGRYFTQLDWARQQFKDKLGVDPYPGTINLAVDDPESLKTWSKIKSLPGVRINNPNDGPNDCDARCYLVSLGGRVDGAIVFPEVAGYSPTKVEIVFALEVRDALGLNDGDLLSVEIK